MQNSCSTLNLITSQSYNCYTTWICICVSGSLIFVQLHNIIVQVILLIVIQSYEPLRNWVVRTVVRQVISGKECGILELMGGMSQRKLYELVADKLSSFTNCELPISSEVVRTARCRYSSEVVRTARCRYSSEVVRTVVRLWKRRLVSKRTWFPRELIDYTPLNGLGWLLFTETSGNF